MSHLSMVIADSIGRTRGRGARWCLSTYAHLNARTDFSIIARNPHLLWLSQPSLRGSTPNSWLSATSMMRWWCPPRLMFLSTKSPRPIFPLGFVTDRMLRLLVLIPAWKQSASSASRRVSWEALVLPVYFLHEWMWSLNSSMT